MQDSSNLSEIDLNLIEAQKTVEQLKIGRDKPQLSKKALNRISRRHRQESPTPSGNKSRSTSPSPLITASLSLDPERTTASLEKISGSYL